MSSICAIADINSHKINFDLLRKMGHAMTLRGRRDRGAYLNRGVGLLCGDAGCLEGEVCQPYTLNVGGKRYTIAIDGKALLPMCDPSLLCTEQILRRYAEIGCEAVCELCGSFALVIFDEHEKRLIIARDRDGSKPLYYCRTDEGKLAIASEVKGLLPVFPDGARVSSEAYRSLIVAPSGMVSAADLYRDIFELEAGSLAILDESGFYVSKYTCIYPSSVKGDTPAKKIAFRPVSEYDLNLVLCESLVAFDYPQFDLFMPDLLGLIRENRGAQRLVYEEPFWDIDRKYAFEKADRLGMICGIQTLPVRPASSAPFPARYARAIEKKLSELVGKLDYCNSYKSVFSLVGDTASDIIKKERNVARRARLFAILLQTKFWAENYPLVFD